VHAGNCDNGSFYQWEILPYGGYHYLKSISSGKCLDLPNWNPNDGVIYQTFPCNYSTAQLFIVPSCTSCWGEIRNVASGKCVDLQWAGLTSGTPFWQWPCAGVAYGTQWFYFDTHSTENYTTNNFRWYQRYWHTFNYTTWMTLSFDRQVLAGGSTYNSYVTNAVNAWNGLASTNTVYLAESAPAEIHDVHLAVLSGGGCHFGNWALETCLDGVVARTAFWGLSGSTKVKCSVTCPQAKTYYATIVFNQPLLAAHSVNVRKDIVVHELGHAVGTLEDIPANGLCYTDPRPRIMDYDCVSNSTYDGPQPFDSCAINHLYHDPNWGFSGC
jgi:hypothetical protein